MENDLIPEEREEANQPLIALLRHSLRERESISSTEQAQIVARAQERLTRAGAFASRSVAGETFQRPAQIGSRPIPRAPTRLRGQARFARDMAAVLLAGLLVGATLLIFHAAAPRNTGQPSTATSGPTAQSQINGLSATLHVLTPGPYFLGELVATDVTLTNQTEHTVQLGGASRPDSVCSSSALSVQITSGSEPSFALPRLEIGCLSILYGTHLEPGRTLTMRYYLPVTKSGTVTIAMGGMPGPHQANPLDGHWPSVSIQVAPQAPADRIFTLRNEGAQVTVQGPTAALAHLLYMESMACDHYGAGGPLIWTPLPASTLAQPACPTPHKHWIYLIGAPGYALAWGTHDS